MTKGGEGGREKGPIWAVATSTVLGLGLSPGMPGTVGSLAGVVLYLPAFFMPKEWVLLLPLTEMAVVLFLAAVAVPPVLRATREKDPGWVVLDEVAGMLCALCFIGPDFVRILTAFLLFRLLDIFKPWPIDRLERLPGAWGVMADDMAAGFLAGLLTVLVTRLS